MPGAGSPSTLYVGLMSGTSLDGVDAALADCGAPVPGLVATLHMAYPPALRTAALDLQQNPGAPLEAALALHQALGHWYADTVLALLAASGVAAANVRAIGCHGQTVAHRPRGPAGYTLQLGSGARVAARTGIPTVTDFRSADIALGGQGAPLAPIFHAIAFGTQGQARAVLNLGGMANLTRLGANGQLLGGFDTGPGNVLMDVWMQTQGDASYDQDGACARTGRVLPDLLAALHSHPFLRRPPPKSTGREEFNEGWLHATLGRVGAIRAPVADVQATLAQFTAQTVANAVQAHAPQTERLIVCGGGAYNGDLIERLEAQLPGVPVVRSDAHGIAPEWVEAVAFAWLAAQRMNEIALDLGCVTGACRPATLGCVYLP